MATSYLISFAGITGHDYSVGDGREDRGAQDGVSGDEMTEEDLRRIEVSLGGPASRATVRELIAEVRRLRGLIGEVRESGLWPTWIGNP